MPANLPAAPNPASASLFDFQRHRRGFGEPGLASIAHVL
jgi:hypothetical protein